MQRAAVEHLFFEADLNDPTRAAADYRRAIEDWGQQQRPAVPSLAFVVGPKSAQWEVERPYYEAKAALASMNIASQMVTTELLDDKPRLDWAAGTIALAAFAKLGGIPWVVEAPDVESDLVIGVGRRQVRAEGGRKMTFGYAVTFVSNGLYRQTWSMSPAANQDSYLRRLSQAVHSALTDGAADGAADLDRRPERVVVHLAKRTGAREIEAVQEALRTAGMDLPLAFLRLDDSSIWDIADTGKDNCGANPGTVVRLSGRAALLQVEGVTRRGAPRGPLLVELDRRSTVARDGLDGLVEQVLRLAHANWRSFTGRTNQRHCTTESSSQTSLATCQRSPHGTRTVSPWISSAGPGSCDRFARISAPPGAPRGRHRAPQRRLVELPHRHGPGRGRSV